MIRTQIQLSEEQYARLRDLAHRQRTSVAALVRQGVERLLASGSTTDPDRRQQAKRLAGAFSSKEKDVAARHDKYLTEIFHK